MMPELDTSDIEKLYERLLEQNLFIEQNEAYVDGKNPYILSQETKKKPDNRIPVTLAKMTVEDIAGYAGREGDIGISYQLTEGDTDENDPFVKYMVEMDSYNDLDIENSELYVESLVQGASYEIWWTSDEMNLEKGLLTAEYKIVPNSEVVLSFTQDLKKKLSHAAHFNEFEETDIVDVYYPLYSEQWIKPKDKATWTRNEEGDTTYPYESVPVNIFRSNRKAKPIFEAEKQLIDAIDVITSKSMNEVDRFNAAIALFGDRVDQQFRKGFAEGLISLIDSLNESGDTSFIPQYLEKDLQGSKDFYKELTDRIELWYRKSVKISDLSDPALAADASGIALMIKMLPMEYRAAQIETYFNQGLKKRLEFYADVYNASTEAVDVDDYELIVKAQRNIPVDNKSKAEIVQLLQGIVSNETLLEFLPKEIVKDVALELERKESEVPETTIDLLSSGQVSDDT